MIKTKLSYKDLIMELGLDIKPTVKIKKQLKNAILYERKLKLKKRYIKIIYERYFCKKTLEEISHDFNVTRERVRQMLNIVIRKLRHPQMLRVIMCCIDSHLKLLYEIYDKVERIENYLEVSQIRKYMLKQSLLKKRCLISVNDVIWSTRTFNCLRKYQFKTLGDIAMKTETQLLVMQDFGKLSLREIKNVLNEHGLKLKGDKVNEYD